MEAPEERIIKHYGLISRLDLLIEEASELIQAVIKLKRYGITPETLKHFAEEAADVDLVKNQLESFMDLKEMKEEYYNIKLERTLTKID